MTSLRHTLSATTIATTVAAALLVSLAGPAWSQAPGTAPATPAHRHDGDQGHGHGHGYSHGMKDGERGPQGHERRMNELKTQLQLTPAQEAAWTRFTDAMRPTPNTPRADYEAMMKLPTPQRLDQMRAMRQQHIAQMDQHAEAVKAFYATLTPEQKKRFDDQAARMMTRHGGMGRSGHHGHHGHHS